MQEKTAASALPEHHAGGNGSTAAPLPEQPVANPCFVSSQQAINIQAKAALAKEASTEFGDVIDGARRHLALV